MLLIPAKNSQNAAVVCTSPSTSNGAQPAAGEQHTLPAADIDTRGIAVAELRAERRQLEPLVLGLDEQADSVAGPQYPG